MPPKHPIIPVTVDGIVIVMDVPVEGIVAVTLYTLNATSPVDRTVAFTVPLTFTLPLTSNEVVGCEWECEC